MLAITIKFKFYSFCKSRE